MLLLLCECIPVNAAPVETNPAVQKPRRNTLESFWSSNSQSRTSTKPEPVVTETTTPECVFDDSLSDECCECTLHIDGNRLLIRYEDNDIARLRPARARDLIELSSSHSPRCWMLKSTIDSKSSLYCLMALQIDDIEASVRRLVSLNV